MLTEAYWISFGRRCMYFALLPPPRSRTFPFKSIAVSRSYSNFRSVLSPGNLRFRSIDSADRLQKTLGVYPRWAFLRTTITTSELPTSEYFRQIFLYTDLVPTRKYSAYDYLTPSQVEDVGNLIWIENISQMYRLDNQIEEISLVFEF